MRLVLERPLLEAALVGIDHKIKRLEEMKEEVQQRLRKLHKTEESGKQPTRKTRRRSLTPRGGWRYRLEEAKELLRQVRKFLTHSKRAPESELKKRAKTLLARRDNTDIRPLSHQERAEVEMAIGMAIALTRSKPSVREIHAPLSESAVTSISSRPN